MDSQGGQVWSQEVFFSLPLFEWLPLSLSLLDLTIPFVSPSFRMPYCEFLLWCRGVLSNHSAHREPAEADVLSAEPKRLPTPTPLFLCAQGILPILNSMTSVVPAGTDRFCQSRRRYLCVTSYRVLQNAGCVVVVVLFAIPT